MACGMKWTSASDADPDSLRSAIVARRAMFQKDEVVEARVHDDRKLVIKTEIRIVLSFA